MGSPPKPAQFVAFRVLTHLSVIPIYLLLQQLGASEPAVLAVFIGLIFVFTKLRGGYDPGRVTLTQRELGVLDVYGKFVERSIGPNSGWSLDALRESSEKLELIVRKGGQVQTVSLGAESFRQAKRNLLYGVISSLRSGDVETMTESLRADGISLRQMNGNTLAIFGEQPGYAKLVFSSLGISLAIFGALYWLYLS